MPVPVSGIRPAAIRASSSWSFRVRSAVCDPALSCSIAWICPRRATIRSLSSILLGLERQRRLDQRRPLLARVPDARALGGELGGDQEAEQEQRDAERHLPARDRPDAAREGAHRGGPPARPGLPPRPRPERRRLVLVPARRRNGCPPAPGGSPGRPVAPPSPARSASSARHSIRRPVHRPVVSTSRRPKSRFHPAVRPVRPGVARRAPSEPITRISTMIPMTPAMGTSTRATGRRRARRGPRRSGRLRRLRPEDVERGVRLRPGPARRERPGRRRPRAVLGRRASRASSASQSRLEPRHVPAEGRLERLVVGHAVVVRADQLDERVRPFDADDPVDGGDALGVGEEEPRRGSSGTRRRARRAGSASRRAPRPRPAADRSRRSRRTRRPRGPRSASAAGRGTGCRPQSGRRRGSARGARRSRPSSRRSRPG